MFGDEIPDCDNGIHDKAGLSAGRIIGIGISFSFNEELDSIFSTVGVEDILNFEMFVSIFDVEWKGDWGGPRGEDCLYRSRSRRRKTVWIWR